MNPQPNEPHPLRAHFIWGVAEIEVVVSLRGMIPDCFRPDTRQLHFLRSMSEDTAPHKILRLCVGAYKVLALAVAENGVPDIFRIKDLRETPIPMKVGGDPVVH